MKPDNLPNFLIIGAHKAGTTSLYHYLNQHPEVYLPEIKEPRFFALKDEKLNYQGPNDPANRCNYRTVEKYKSLFKNSEKFKMRGEASTIYHYSKIAPLNIKEFIPNVKIIMILRHPVQRAFSNYVYALRDRRETESNFKFAIEKESIRIKNNWGPLWHYKQRGLYGEQMERYFELFKKEQIKFVLYEDFTDDPLKTYTDICNFLHVDNTFKPNLDLNFNPSGIAKNNMLQGFLVNPHPLKAIFSFLPNTVKSKLKLLVMKSNLSRDDKPMLDKECYNMLLEYYYNDIIKLQSITGLDLSSWLKYK